MRAAVAQPDKAAAVGVAHDADLAPADAGDQTARAFELLDRADVVPGAHESFTLSARTVTLARALPR